MNYSSTKSATNSISVHRMITGLHKDLSRTHTCSESNGRDPLVHQLSHGLTSVEPLHHLLDPWTPPRGCCLHNSPSLGNGINLSSRCAWGCALLHLVREAVPQCISTQRYAIGKAPGFEELILCLPSLRSGCSTCNTHSRCDCRLAMGNVCFKKLASIRR